MRESILYKEFNIYDGPVEERENLSTFINTEIYPGEFVLIGILGGCKPEYIDIGLY